MALDVHEFLAKLPRASTPEQPLPHDGCLLEVIQEVKDLGYVPVDVRFLDGPDAVRLSLQGNRLHTVRMIDVDALRLEAQLYGLLNPKTPRDPNENKLVKGDVLDRLKAMGSKEPIIVAGSQTAPPMAGAPVVLPKRSRGQRGPDKKPRKLGGSAKRSHDNAVELTTAVSSALQHPSS